MTKEAADVLQQFYLQLRKHSSADGSPITARQLESLVRLVEARARIELREDISKQDAQVCDPLARLNFKFTREGSNLFFPKQFVKNFAFLNCENISQS